MPEEMPKPPAPANTETRLSHHANEEHENPLPKDIGEIIPLDFNRYVNQFKKDLLTDRKEDQPEKITFEDVAGQDDAVREARKLVNAINNPEVFTKRGVKRPKGILLYGPPGTGKTLIARAIASEADAVFIPVSGGDVQSKWINHSVELMQQVFDRANAIAEGKDLDEDADEMANPVDEETQKRMGKLFKPAPIGNTAPRRVILFFDEIDAIASERSNITSGSREDAKVVSILLQNIDGMLANPNITIIAATNRPDIVDPALKRPGRIDKVIEVGLPQKPEERRAILQVHINKAKKAATEAESLFSPELDLDQVAAATRGMSGAELANLINLTLEEKVTLELEGTPWTPTTTEDLIAKVPSLKQQEEEKRRIGFRVPQRIITPTT